MLDLFTTLVFLLALVGVYTTRAFSRSHRRSERVAARLAELRRIDAYETDGGGTSGTGADIALAVPGPLLPFWPWLDAHLRHLREGLRQLGWLATLRFRLVLTAGAALAVASVLGRMSAAPLAVSVIGSLGGFIIIATIAYQSAMGKRLAELSRNLPETIDAITRVCRAGVPLHSAFAIAAAHLHGPLSDELRQIDQWLRLGIPIRKAMQDSAQRVALAEYRFFAVILIISQESGGRLGDTLDRLSSTLRARAELKMKVQAKTSEARASTKIVAALVPGVLAYMYLNAPRDFRFLFSDPAGIKVATYAAVSVALGLLITHLMVRRIA